LLDDALSDDEVGDEEDNQFPAYNEDYLRTFEDRFSARTRPTTYKSKATTDTYKSLQVWHGSLLPKDVNHWHSGQNTPSTFSELYSETVFDASNYKFRIELKKISFKTKPETC
jgi:hypothetical protein